MRIALVIAARILRQRIRDRSAIIFAVVTPLGLALAFSAVITDFTPEFHTTIAVVDQDGGEAAQALVDGPLGGLVASGIADITVFPTESAARAAVSSEQVGVAVVIPSGFTAAIQDATPTQVRILGVAGSTSREVVRASVSRFADTVGARQLTIETLVATGGTADPATVARVGAALASGGVVGITDTSAVRRQATLATFYGAAMAIMFVFFATQYGALAVLSERRNGTLNRLLAAPISQASVILGGSIAGFALGLLAMTVLVIATTVLGHAAWGPPPLVAVLVVAAVISAIGISTLVATLARTVEQAGGINAIVALCMAAIGGVFIPLAMAPEALARISFITPHAWFLRAIDTLAVPSVGFLDILPSVLALLAIGGLTGAIGLARARRALVPA